MILDRVLEPAVAAVAAHSEVARTVTANWSDAVEDRGCNTKDRLAMFLGQLAHESARFTARIENLNYSAAGLRATWPRHFTAQQARDYARQPEKIANRAYRNRMGNGSEASGDGWRYRGRGYIHITGRANYRKYGPMVHLDLEAHPERAEEPAIALLIAASYFQTRTVQRRSLWEWSDDRDVVTVTKGINGGLNGYSDRLHLVGLAERAIMSVPDPIGGRPPAG